MHVSTKGRFAVTAMADLAFHSSGYPVCLSSISLRQRISLSYLEQLIGKLRRHDLVRSIRGPGGGYLLTREPACISIADIVAAVDDAPRPDPDDARWPQDDTGTRFDTSALWLVAGAKVTEYLGSITLASLVEKQPRRQEPVSSNASRRGISAEPVVKRLRTNAPNSVFALGAALQDVEAPK